MYRWEVMQPENLRNDRNASNYKNYKKYEIIEVGSRYVGRHIVRWQLDKTHLQPVPSRALEI